MYIYRSLTIALFLFLFLSVAFSKIARADAELSVSTGQTIYIPSYSHILHGNFNKSGKPDSLLLSTLLSIRNTDPERTISVVSAKYYDTDGKPVQEFVPTPIEIQPLATAQYMVEHKDSAGGSGAKFLVTWKSDLPVNMPLIETVNAYFFGSQSTAFTTTGRPISRVK
jgi:hypothetical protein